MLAAPHRKPYPDERAPVCEGAGTSRHIVLGTDFITDIALFSLQVAPPLQLKPGHYPTDVALRTVSEALAKAGSQVLEIEPGELMAEYRPSLTPGRGAKAGRPRYSSTTPCRAARGFPGNSSIKDWRSLSGRSN